MWACKITLNRLLYDKVSVFSLCNLRALCALCGEKNKIHHKAPH